MYLLTAVLLVLVGVLPPPCVRVEPARTVSPTIASCIARWFSELWISLVLITVALRPTSRHPQCGTSAYSAGKYSSEHPGDHRVGCVVHGRLLTWPFVASFLRDDEGHDVLGVCHVVLCISSSRALASWCRGDRLRTSSAASFVLLVVSVLFPPRCFLVRNAYFGVGMCRLSGLA